MLQSNSPMGLPCKHQWYWALTIWFWKYVQTFSLDFTAKFSYVISFQIQAHDLISKVRTNFFFGFYSWILLRDFLSNISPRFDFESTYKLFLWILQLNSSTWFPFKYKWNMFPRFDFESTYKLFLWIWQLNSPTRFPFKYQLTIWFRQYVQTFSLDLTAKFS